MPAAVSVRQSVAAAAALAALHALAVALAWAGAFWLRPMADFVPFLEFPFDATLRPEMDFFVPFVAWECVVFVAVMAYLGAYQLPRPRPTDLRRAALGAALLAALTIAFFYLFRHEVFFSRGMLMQATALIFVFAAAFSAAWRFGCAHTLHAPRNIMVVGSGASAARLAEAAGGGGVVSAQELIEKGEAGLRGTDELWCAADGLSPEMALKVLALCFSCGVPVRAEPLWGVHTESPEALLGGVALCQALPTPMNGWHRVGKRAVDVGVAATLLIVLAPALLVISAAVRCTSTGPALYKSQRVGRNGQLFWMWKFRSMHVGADAKKDALRSQNHRGDGPFFKVKNDPRVTHLGRWLRRTSLDELPQLWNVLRGEMSLVGPRPHLPQEVSRFPLEFKMVLALRPGLTGLSQISGRSDLPFAEEMRLDLLYLRTWSAAGDGAILAKTVGVVLSGRAAD